MADLNELKGLVEQINQTLVPLRTEVDTLKQRDGLDEQRLERMATEVATKCQAAIDALARDVAQVKAQSLGGVKALGRDDTDPRWSHRIPLRSCGSDCRSRRRSRAVSRSRR